MLRRIMMRTLFLGACALLLSNSQAHAKVDIEANQLLQYFSAGCASQGQWTQTALGYAGGLVETLKSLAEDEDCKTINGALVQAQTLTSALTAFSQDTNARQIAGLKKQEQQLLLFISTSTDADELTALTQQLQAVQLQIAQNQSFAVSDTAFQDEQRSSRALSTLVSGTGILLQQAVQNQSCIQNHKAFSLFSGIAGLAGSVGAIALTGGESLLAAAGIDIVNNVIEAVRKYGQARRIMKVTTSLSAAAYQCTLETLSNQWCAADDALRVLKLHANSITAQKKPTPLQSVTQILNRDLNEFSKWLESVRAGTGSNTLSMALTMEEVIKRDGIILSAAYKGNGIIADSRRLFDQIPVADIPAQWNQLLQTITKILSAFEILDPTGTYVIVGSGSSPLKDVFSSDPNLLGGWFLIGIADANIPRDQNGNRRSIRSVKYEEILTINPNFKPNLTIIKDQLTDWISRGRALVDRERAIILNLDPQKLIIDAATPSINKQSPYGSLQNIIGFLKERQRSGFAVVGSFKGLYDDTVKRLETIEGEIKKILSEDETAATPAEAINIIAKQAVLENGTAFLRDRTLWAVRLTLNQLILDKNSDISPSDAAALLVKNDIIAEIQSYANSGSLNDQARDIEKSKAVIQKTIANFTKLFSKGLKKTVAEYQSQSLIMNEGENGPNKKELAELCLKLLASPVWPKKVPQETCLGVQLKSSAFDKGPASEIVTLKLINAPFAERVCKFRDYNRKNWLYQQFLGGNPVN